MLNISKVDYIVGLPIRFIISNKIFFLRHSLKVVKVVFNIIGLGHISHFRPTLLCSFIFERLENWPFRTFTIELENFIMSNFV